MSTPPYRNPALPIETRIDDLLGRMTLAEKLGQCHQMHASDEQREKIREAARAGRIGSRILATSATAGNDPVKSIDLEESNRVQRIAVEESRLGIPILNGRDVIHGHRTVFPVPLGVAATWDPECARTAGEVCAREASAQGVHWTFAPMIDIARDPRWGRIVEGSGEDPLLSAAMGAGWIGGFQGDFGPGHLLACAKHFVGYGGAEGGRDYNTAEISANTLHNIYLPPFEAACAAGVASIMSGFHDLNGESASGSPELIQGLLKDTWLWDGFIISDWASVTDMIQHGVAADRREAAAQGLLAGVDMEMCTGSYEEHLPQLIADGVVPLARLDDAVRRILRAKFRLGLFERPYTDLAGQTAVIRRPDHLEAAQRVAEKSLVLLRNVGGVLPLAAAVRRKIVVAGPLAEPRRFLLGTWTLDGLPEETPSLAEALRETAPGIDWDFVPPGMGDRSVNAIKRADLVLLALGEDDTRSGENCCVSDIGLPPGQIELVRQAKVWGKPVVAVVFAGRPLAMPELLESADAVLYAWHPGSRGAHAVARVLFGQTEPEGRSPVSFPRTTGSVPCHYNHKPTGKCWPNHGPQLPDNLSVTDRYQDVPGTPLVPFGFGLAYTEFALEDLRLDRDRVPLGEGLGVTVRVRNTGARTGSTVVQLYLRDHVAETTRPVRELKAWQRLSLAPGEAREVRLELPPVAFRYFGRKAWRSDRGACKLWVGFDASATLSAEFQVV